MQGRSPDYRANMGVIAVHVRAERLGLYFALSERVKVIPCELVKGLRTLRRCRLSVELVRYLVEPVGYAIEYVGKFLHGVLYSVVGCSSAFAAFLAT